MRLDGRVAVITGGTRGIGRCIAEAFLAEGAQVLCAGRTEPDPALLPRNDGVRASFHPVDVRDPDSVRTLLRDAFDRFGKLDIVVANAGVSRPGPVAALSAEQWSQVITTNVHGVFHCIQAAVPYLERSGGGRILTMSSALATRVMPGVAAYSASKAAVEMITRIAAVELAAKGITVNCLAPGIIDEGMGRQIIANERMWQRYQPKLASGRAGRGAEVSSAAVFLASDEASYVNGHVLEVNGGLHW